MSTFRRTPANAANLGLLLLAGVVLVLCLFIATNEGKAMKNDSSRANEKLNPMQRYVTKECGTEPPFQNAYWDNHRPGIYVDIVSGEPLFSSRDKFESGTGWPSFTKPLEESNVAEKPDVSHGMVRTEVKSAHAGSHLGHLFNDGPAPTGQRYCINSAALRFIPAEELEKEGYGQYRYLFAKSQPEFVSKPGTSPAARAEYHETAIFAAGCFWGVEYSFKHVPGVISVRSGYTGGKTADPTYPEVCTDTTGHAEAVEVTFDPTAVSYDHLLDLFWQMHDPTTPNRQGVDVGTQYRSAIFYNSEEQRQAALRSKERLEQSHQYHGRIVTEIVPEGKFYPAEEYHQNYLEKHPERVPFCHVLIAH